MKKNPTLQEIIFKNLLSTQNKVQLSILKRGGDNGVDNFSSKRLNELALKLAIYLDQNYNTEKKLIISMELGVHSVITIIACMYAGKTFIPVPPPKTKNDIERINGILNECDISTVLTSDKSQYLFKSESLFQKHINILNLNIDLIDSYSIDISNLKSKFYRLQKNKTINIESLIMIQYTSGSTSKPKGVKITAQNILTNHKLVSESWGFDSDKNYLSWLPIHHDMGLFSLIYATFLSKMKTYLMTPEDFVKRPIRWLKAISDYKIYLSGGPPFAYDICIKSFAHDNNIKLDLSHWKVAFCGADYVPAKLMEEFREFGKKHLFNKHALFATYGMAENTLFITGEPFWKKNNLENKTSSKTLSEGCYISENSSESFLVYDDTSHNIASKGESGEIIISGKSTTTGYIADGFQRVFIKNKEWFKTGDIGFVENNFLFVTSRKKDLIKIYGRSLFVNDIVATLSKNYKELNTNASHIFKKDDFSNSLIVILELNSKLARYTGEFLSLLKKNIFIALFEEFGVRAEEILVLGRGTLPKTTSGKVQRNKVKYLYNKGHF